MYVSSWIRKLELFFSCRYFFFEMSRVSSEPPEMTVDCLRVVVPFNAKSAAKQGEATEHVAGAKDEVRVKPVHTSDLIG